MRFLWRMSRWLGATLLLIFLLLALLIGSRQGTAWLWTLQGQLLPGMLQCSLVQGSLWRGLNLNDCRWRQAELQASWQALAVRFDWPGLRRRQLHLPSLTVRGLKVVTPSMAKDEKKQHDVAASWTPDDLRRLHLPLMVDIDRLLLEDVQYQQAGQQALILQHAVLRASVQDLLWRFDINKLQYHDLGLNLRFFWQPGMDKWTLLSGVHGRWPGLHELKLVLQAEGSLNSMQGSVQTKRPQAAILNWQMTHFLQPERLHWQADLQSASLTVQRWLTRPSGSWSGAIDLTAQGSQADFSADARVQVKQGLPWPVSLTVHGHGDSSHIVLDPVRANSSEGDISVLAQASLFPDQQRLDLQLDWQGRIWPIPGLDDQGLPPIKGTGGLQWKGSARHYQAVLRAETQAADRLPAMRWRWHGEGDQQGLDQFSLHTSLLDGKIQAHGQLHWLPTLSGQLDMDWSDLNIAYWQAAWPSRLGGSVHLQGQQEGDALQFMLRDADLHGELKHLPLQLHAPSIQHTGNSWQLASLSAQWGQAELHGSGVYREQQGYTADLALQVPDLSPWFEGARGRIQLQGKLSSGASLLPDADLTIALQQAYVADYALQALTGSLHLHAAEQRSQKLDVHVSGLHIPGRAPINGLVLIEGPWTQQQWVVSLEEADHLFNTVLLSDWNIQQGMLDLKPVTGTLQWGEHIPWYWTEGMKLHIEPGQLRLSQGCWQAWETRLCVQGAWQKDRSQAQWQLDRMPLYWLLQDRSDQLFPSSTLSSHGQWHMDGQGVMQFDLGLSMEAGTLVVNPATERQFAIELPALDWQLRQEGSQLVSALWSSGAGDQLNIGLSLSPLSLSLSSLQDWQSLPIEAHVQADMQDWDWLPQVVPQVTDPAGRLSLTVNVHGSLGKPAWDAALTVQNGRLSIPSQGVDLQQLAVQIDSASQGTQTLDLQAVSGKGALHVEGKMTELEPVQAEFTVQGKDFLALNRTHALRLLMTPDIHGTVNDHLIDLTGSVIIPEALIQLQSFASGALVESSDVHLVQADAPPPEQPWQVSSVLDVTLGEQVRLQGYGLDSYLTGSLALLEDPGHLMTGYGVLETRQGKYKAFGQELSLTRGRLLFVGGPLDNPALDIEARREIREVTAGVFLQGQLVAPHLSLFSEPPMPQADILSYLLIGRPLSQASQSEGDQLLSASAALELAGGSKLARDIGQRLGLDEVRVAKDTKGDQHSSLVLGKYLNPRLYMSYGIGLSAPINTLLLRLDLSRQWQLQVESALYTGGDLFYSQDFSD